MSDINVGAMREILQIQHRVTTQNDCGDVLTEWQPFCKIRAYANGLFGNELIEARKTSNENTVKFVVRYNRKLEQMDTHDHRILWRGQVYNIVPPIDNPQYQNKTLTISAECHNGGTKNVI